MFDRLRRGSAFLPAATREFSIPRPAYTETGVLHVWDVTVRMSAFIAAVAVLSPVTGGAMTAVLTGASSLALAALARGSYVRHLRIRLK
ncbi:hypothetical protein [Streptomyces noursei]|uniref:Uncharacterized protein n=1 Tax=Streptomyces noursei TaxID=1971 RepID=A0A401QRQ6_STRNR|nr:hypothetical protein [Streptomyces noursei]UWS76898.1 hypothetical protein N1H47_40050 [Streptomyces noursei]GCB88099.1 hypothetical protein SALB_00768 [Streptomyces noursei]